MYTRILVPLDSSKRAEAILPHVQNLASAFHSQIILLSVVEPLPVPTEDGSFFYQVDDGRQQEYADYLEGVKRDLLRAGCNVTTRVEYGGSVVSVIMKVAEEEQADLIAFASHGRTGLQRVFYGSVAASLLHRADRPLLLVRAL